MNAAKSMFGRVAGVIAQNKQILSLAIYVIVAAAVVYSVYTVLFPPPDKFQQNILTSTLPGSELQGRTTALVPPMATGGDYSLQFWLYLNSWDYKSGQAKHVFSIASDGKPAGGRPAHVSMLGMLYPNENKMMIRVNQDPESLSAAGISDPDFTIANNISALYKGTMSPGTYPTTTSYPICDIQELDLQKWVCLSIVVSGRVIDVYVDGKLSRSCVCPGVPIVETGNNSIVLGDNSGFGGAMSTCNFYGYALTPAAIYAFYQNGPAIKAGLDAKFGFIGWLAQTLGLNVNYNA